VPKYNRHPADTEAVADMPRDFWRIIGTLLVVACGPTLASGYDATPEAIEFFEKEIRPILVARCHECHGQAEKIQGGLSLVSRAGLMAGGVKG